MKAEFSKIVSQHQKRVVIFVDDLDRLQPQKAVEVLEVLKVFLDCENCVFVLGDNRNDSTDSRDPSIGMIDTREILGKAIFLLFPGSGEKKNTAPRDFHRIGALN